MANQKVINNILKYSGAGFQMLAIILLGAWGGTYLDSRYQTSKPYFTMACTLLAVFLALGVVLKDFLVKK
ncbi:MAG: AtpZ/AtpI family protein [Chitinophagales bacterium]|nr:AtpZ/AtpI family protein [Bacteroidota bacterium]